MPHTSKQVAPNNSGIAIKMISNALEQTKFDVAKSMASQGYPMEEIYLATGLTIADIKQVLD